MNKLFTFGLILCTIASFRAKGNSRSNLKGETIKLDDPVTEGGMPLYEALAARKSDRDFKHEDELTLAQLSQLLWAGYGPNRENLYKTAPSSKEKFPLLLYVFRADAVYLYLPDSNELEKIKDGDWRGLTGQDDYVPNAAVNIAMIGDLDKETVTHDIEGKKMCVRVDVGHSVMNMLLYSASEGLKCVPRTNFIESGILEFFGLSPEHYYVPICLSVGP